MFSAFERAQPNISNMSESVMGPFSSMPDVGPTRRYRSSASSTRLSPGASIFKHTLFPSCQQNPARYDVHSSGRFNQISSMFCQSDMCWTENEARLRAFHDPDAKSKRKECLILLEKTPASGELNPAVQWQNIQKHLELTKSQTNILIQGLCKEVLSEQNLSKTNINTLTPSETFKGSEMVWVFFCIRELSKLPGLKDLQSFLQSWCKFAAIDIARKNSFTSTPCQKDTNNLYHDNISMSYYEIYMSVLQHIRFGWLIHCKLEQLLEPRSLKLYRSIQKSICCHP